MSHKAIGISGFILAFLVAFAVRAFWIGHPSLWTDEIFTLLYSRESLMHLLSLTRTSDIHPPFYYILVKGVAYVFGEGDGTKLRLISAISSALSAGVLFLFVRHRFGISVAVVATVFFVLFPINVHYGRELRAYSTLALALLCACVCFHEMLEANRETRRRRLFALGYAASLVLAFHLHYSSIVFFFLFFVSSFALRALDSDSRNLRLALGATIVAGIVCLPQSFHFLWARAHTASDFWIETTTWRQFYATSLAAYPFPAWAKLIVYPFYLAGAWILWRLDRRFAVIACVILVGGPATMALIGLWTPTYLVRSIQAFTVLSPLLMALSLVSLPRVLVLPSIAALAAIHIFSIRSYFPAQAEGLAIDQIAPVVARAEPNLVYYASQLEEQIRLRNLEVRNWVPVTLTETSALDLVAERMERCADQNDCGFTVVVMERSPRFLVEEGRIWMAGMDTLSESYDTHSDLDIGGMRVLILH